MSVEITERWLMDAGGWQAMKAARAAWQAGAVSAVEFDGTRLRGQVRSGGRTLAAGLLIRSRTDVGNLCGCPVSRRDGALCEHSLALGLAWVHRGTAAAAKSTQSAPSAGAPADPKPSQSCITSPPSVTRPPQTSGPLLISLPPNLMEGLRRHRLTVAIRPAPAGTEETDADRALHRWIAAQQLTSLPPQLALADRTLIESLLCSLIGHPAVRIAGKTVGISASQQRLPLRVVQSRKNDVGSVVDQNIASSATPSSSPGRPSNASEFRGHSSDPLILEIEPKALQGVHWWAAPSRGFLFDTKSGNIFVYNTPELISPFIADDGKPRAASLAWAWLARNGHVLSEVFELDEADPRWPRLRLVSGSPRIRMVLEGTLRRVTAQVWCRYESSAEFSLPAGELHPDPFPIPDPQDPSVFIDRDRKAEEAAVQRLRQSGFVYDASVNALILNSESAVLEFYAGKLASLEREWTVEFGPRARETFGQFERLTPQFREVAQGNDWLSFDLALVGSSGGTVTAADARRWLQTGQGGKRLPNGKLALLAKEVFQDLEEVLRDLDPRQEQGHFRVSESQRGYLEASVNAVGATTPPESGVAISEKIFLTNYWQKLLRPYQQLGARWMIHLAEQGWGGILADEMGLGKTVQTLAVVSALRARTDRDPNDRRPCLVVAPTSLLGNWREECAKFAPELQPLVVRSGERSADLAALANADLVITSYQLLVRDLDHHRAVDYAAAFLDEAGFIRNPDTQAAQAVRRLRTKARFALTGTPIENSIRDLWSIMDFVLPGYLGRREDFRERYEGSVLAGDASALRRLRRRLAPYWLRRLKQEVARDLPAKIEKIVRCELTDIQRDIYSAIQREGVRKVEEARKSQTASQSRLTLLTALLRLRQTCGDPRLLGESFPDRDPSEFSAKWAALIELLEEIRDGGHNVLIFSQFSTQLTLLEPALDLVGMDYCRLDGTTRDRDAQVASFQNCPEKRAFLISLKAGGFGLNLTKADTVVHFDPWWNPAVEAQATDRAHRIGQARPVTVYKFITAHTVEEKILALQQRKRQLMETTLADDTAPLMDSLDDQTLNTLLEG
jgi:superfamily II DNA or RNA helicase